VAERLRVIDLRSHPDLDELVDEVGESRKACRIQRDGQDVAILVPAGRPRRFRKGDPTSEDDPIWRIFGMVTSDGPGDVSRNVDKYLAEAYLDKHDRHE
jgi:hypothetical protein